MNTFRDLLSRHQLSAFFVLAFTLTWTAFIPWYLSQGEGIPWFTFGPLAAGLLIAVLTGGWRSVRSMIAPVFHWRVNFRWYLVAIGLPFAIQFTSIFANTLSGAPAPAWGAIPPLDEIMPMVILYGILSGPLGEEPGWRGFAMPRLLARYSALTGSLILGVLWATWHLPLGLVGDLSIYGSVTAVAAAIVFTWVYQNSGGSVLLAILMHVAHQNSVRYLGKVYAGNDYLQQQWIGAAIWIAVAVTIVVFYGAGRFVRKVTPQASPVVTA